MTETFRPNSQNTCTEPGCDEPKGCQSDFGRCPVCELKSRGFEPGTHGRHSLEPNNCLCGSWLLDTEDGVACEEELDQTGRAFADH